MPVVEKDFSDAWNGSPFLDHSLLFLGLNRAGQNKIAKNLLRLRNTWERAFVQSGSQSVRA